MKYKIKTIPLVVLLQGMIIMNFSHALTSDVSVSVVTLPPTCNIDKSGDFNFGTIHVPKFRGDWLGEKVITMSISCDAPSMMSMTITTEGDLDPSQSDFILISPVLSVAYTIEGFSVDNSYAPLLYNTDGSYLAVGPGQPHYIPWGENGVSVDLNYSNGSFQPFSSAEWYFQANIVFSIEYLTSKTTTTPILESFNDLVTYTLVYH